MNQRLHLHLFGSPQISYQGEPLNNFISAKVRALLIYLAVTARPHSRDHLAHLLWSDTPASMKVNLRKALSNLRQLIGEVLVEEGKELVSLDQSACWVDVQEFEQQAKAGSFETVTHLYTADFLAGFNPSLSYEFESWVLSEQNRLKSQMVDLLRKAASQTEQAGDLSAAIANVRRLLELEAWQEEAHRWLMRLLAQNGQRSAALAHFEVCKKVLKEELAVEPDAETVKLVEGLQHTIPTPLKAQTKTQRKPQSLPKPEFPLIGRETEWQTIQQAWQACLENGTHFVSIAGEAGIGKTRLTEEARLWVAQQGYASAYARSYAAEGALAYSPVVDWLRSEPIRSSLNQLDSIWLNEIVRLLPELLKSHHQLSSPFPLNDAAQRRLFFEALARAFCTTNEPMLLVIDDLQWCDRETLEWLRFLLRFDVSQPLLLIGTYRVEEVDQDHPLQTLLLSLRREEVVTEIELGMLREAATSALIHIVAANGISSERINELWKATTGHPLFVIESLRNEGEQHFSKVIPRKIQSVIQARLIQLSNETRSLAELAAVVGRSFTPKLLIEASKREENAVVSSLDELWQRRIIVQRDNTWFDFSHDRIRETVDANIYPVNRQRLHQQVAEALKALYTDDLSEWNGQIAVHYQLAGKPADALPHFAEAVETLFRRHWAFHEVLATINRALLLTNLVPETEANLRHLLSLRCLQYDAILAIDGYTSPQLRDVIDQVSQMSKKLNDHAYNFVARTWLRTYYSFRAEWAKAKEIAAENVAFAQSSKDELIAFEAYFDLANMSFIMGEITAAKIWFDQANSIFSTFDLQSTLSDRERNIYVDFYTTTAGCYYFLGYLDQSDHLENTAQAFVGATNHPMINTLALHNYLRFRIFYRRQNDSLKEKAERLNTISQKFHLVVDREWGRLYHGWILVLDGCYEQGIDAIKTAIDFFERTNYTGRHTLRLGLLMESYRMACRYEEGLTIAHEALAFANRTSEQYWVPELYRLQGELLLGNGAESHEVEESYQKSLAISRQQSSRLLELRTSVSLARLWQSQGKHDAAHQLLAPLYHWFTEGFDMPDLIEAKQLLDALQPHLTSSAGRAIAA